MRAIGAVVVAAVVAGLLPLVMLLTAPPAWACSCASMSDAKYVQHADVIFAGQLVDRTYRRSNMRGTPRTMTFAVDRVYKGDGRALVRVWNPRPVSNCALYLQGKGPFLVFAAHGREGRLYSSFCSGTRELPDRLPAVLGAGHPPEPLEKPDPLKPTPADTGEPVPNEGNGTAMAAWLSGGTAALILLAVIGWRVHRLFRGPQFGHLTQLIRPDTGASE